MTSTNATPAGERPLNAFAFDLLNSIKAWRDSDGNEPFPQDLRERLDASLMAYEVVKNGTYAEQVERSRAAAPATPPEAPQNEVAHLVSKIGRFAAERNEYRAAISGLLTAYSLAMQNLAPNTVARAVLAKCFSDEVDAAVAVLASTENRADRPIPAQPADAVTAALLEMRDALVKIDGIAQAFHEGGYGESGNRKAVLEITGVAQGWLKHAGVIDAGGLAAQPAAEPSTVGRVELADEEILELWERAQMTAWPRRGKGPRGIVEAGIIGFASMLAAPTTESGIIIRAAPPMPKKAKISEYDFKNLTERQKELLTFNGWQPGCMLYPQPTPRTVKKLIERGLLVEHEVDCSTTITPFMVKAYYVPLAVHADWCAHCAAEEGA